MRIFMVYGSALATHPTASLAPRDHDKAYARQLQERKIARLREKAQQLLAKADELEKALR